MGTMGLPSAGRVVGLPSLENIPSAFNLFEPKRLPAAAPSMDRKERRFQPDFRFILSLPLGLLKLTRQQAELLAQAALPPRRCRRFQSANRRESTRLPCRRGMELCRG